MRHSFSFVMLMLIVLCAGMVQANAQACDPIPDGGGQSISANIVEKYTDAAIPDESTVDQYTFLKIHSRAESGGRCYGRVRVEGVCVLSGQVWDRTISHTSVYVDIVSTGLNGNYFVGNVYGMNPNFTTAEWQLLDTTLSNNTGPNQFMVSYPGSYAFKIKAYINTTPCDIQPDQTNQITITVNVGPTEEAATALNWLVKKSTVAYADLLRDV